MRENMLNVECKMAFTLLNFAISRQLAAKKSLGCHILLLLAMTAYIPAHSQMLASKGVQQQTFTYAIKNADTLKLDIYTADASVNSIKRPCVIFLFGGAFVRGRRNDTLYSKYFHTLAERGYVMVSISYRLGLKGIKHISVFNTSPLKNAVYMAVEDVYDATNWAIANASRFGIDTSKIVLSGSSSGAVSVLESDFIKRNNMPSSDKLPEHFQYAGVMAFSGALLSFNGKIKYQIAPAPTLLFHGTADKIMPYHKIRFFNKGLFGSSSLAKTFKAKGYPYYIYRAEGMGHEIAVLPMINQLDAILDFLDHYVMQRKPYQTDMSFKDPNQKAMITMSANELFKNLQKKYKAR